MNRALTLVILDGWGIAPPSPSNSIHRAHTPYYDEISSRYPIVRLEAAGESVGLSAGSPGNAEAGHLNLGAGRVVRSEISRIEAAIRTGEFAQNQVIRKNMQDAAASSRPLHLVGLVSDGGVHSSSATLYALLRMAKVEGVKEVFVHCILDGRDVSPRTADIYIEALEIKMNEIGLGTIASLCGRHFAMDSGGNWDRTARAFTMMVHAEGERASDPISAVRGSFLRGISDEFTAPIVIESEPGKPTAVLNDGDSVIFFNHRADTMRQLVRALAIPDPGVVAASKPKINAACLVEYDASFGLPAAFVHEGGGSTLSSVLFEHEVPNFRFAEAERLPHVTNFLNGGSEGQNKFQRDELIPGPRAAFHEAEPEMGSFKLTDSLLRAMSAGPAGVFIANLSAADLISDLGNVDRTIEAVQYVDTCLGGIYETVAANNGIMVVTSTHGNCEDVHERSSGAAPRPGTMNPVPFHLIDTANGGVSLRDSGTLQDVAPTLLGLIGLPVPDDMSGIDLREVRG